MPEVNRKGLFGEQVHGYRVTGEGIDRQHVELLRGFAFQRKARVAQNDFGLCWTLLQEREPAVCDLDDLRIDFVKSERVARFSVSRKRSRSQSDHAYAFRPVATKSQSQANAGTSSVVRRRVAIFREGKILRAV